MVNVRVKIYPISICWCLVMKWLRNVWLRDRLCIMRCLNASDFFVCSHTVLLKCIEFQYGSFSLPCSTFSQCIALLLRFSEFSATNRYTATELLRPKGLLSRYSTPSHNHVEPNAWGTASRTRSLTRCKMMPGANHACIPELAFARKARIRKKVWHKTTM